MARRDTDDCPGDDHSTQEAGEPEASENDHVARVSDGIIRITTRYAALLERLKDA